ncbi:MAG: hypothetical protein ACKV22_28310, partial [Bryobacteraceae bacterium]
KILASELFSHAESLSRLLRFVVERTLDGQSDQIKEYTLGVEVFGRGESFDPRLDTIVRAQARRLRAKLEKYYQSANDVDGVRIDLAPGSYVPEFHDFDPRGEATGKGQQPEEPGPLRALRRWPWPVAGASAAVVAGILAGVVAHRQEPRSATLRPVPLTSYVGSEKQPSLSPDSRQVAFSWDGEKQDNFDIYIKQIGSGGPVRLTTHPAVDSWPGWSPDGRQIAFHRQVKEWKNDVLITPALGGGPERKVAQVSGNPDHMGMSWSPDSRWLALTECPPSNQCSLFLLSLATGEKRRLTVPPASYYGDSDPAFSPDGRAVSFIRRVGPNTGDLFLLRLSEDLRLQVEPRRLTQENKHAYHLAWTTDGRALLFVSGGEGDGRLLKVSAFESSKLDRASGIEGALGNFAQGRHLVYESATRDSNVWRVAVDGGEAPRSFLASTRADRVAEYSPDGRRIAFVSTRTGSPELWVCDADGGNAFSLTDFGGPLVGVPNWSPDGQQIVFHARPNGQADLFLVRSSGGVAKRLTTDPSDEYMPRFSRDGRWIYFGSPRTGGAQVWKMPAAGGPAQQVTRYGGYVAAESVDRRYLYYSKRDSSELLRMPIEGGGEEKVLDGLAHGTTFGVTADGIYWIATATGGRLSIRFLDFRNRRTTIIATIQKPVDLHLSISPDQHWVLYTQFDQSGSDLMLVENYRP